MADGGNTFPDGEVAPLDLPVAALDVPAASLGLPVAWPCMKGWKGGSTGRIAGPAGRVAVHEGVEARVNGRIAGPAGRVAVREGRKRGSA
jgi:hypothetical protein